MDMIVSCIHVHTCTYCICMYVMTMYSAVRIPLVSNCALQIRFIIIIIIIIFEETDKAYRNYIRIQIGLSDFVVFETKTFSLVYPVCL